MDNIPGSTPPEIFRKSHTKNSRPVRRPRAPRQLLPARRRHRKPRRINQIRDRPIENGSLPKIRFETEPHSRTRLRNRTNQQRPVLEMRPEETHVVDSPSIRHVPNGSRRRYKSRRRRRAESVRNQKSTRFRHERISGHIERPHQRPRDHVGRKNRRSNQTGLEIVIQTRK